MSLERELNLMVLKFITDLQLPRWRWIILCSVRAFPQVRKGTTESIDGVSPLIMQKIGNTLSWYMNIQATDDQKSSKEASLNNHHTSNTPTCRSSSPPTINQTT